MNWYLRLCRNTSDRRWGFGTLPISQAFAWLGPLFVHFAWGVSANLIKEAQ